MRGRGTKSSQTKGRLRPQVSLLPLTASNIALVHAERAEQPAPRDGMSMWMRHEQRSQSAGLRAWNPDIHPGINEPEIPNFEVVGALQKKSWRDKWKPEVLQELFDYSENGWKVQLTSIHYARESRGQAAIDNGIIEVSGVVMFEDLRVGRILRSLWSDGKLVTHDSFELATAAQGHGLARSYDTVMRNRYQDQGLEQIQLLAVNEGCVAWAKLGYDWSDPKEREERRIQTKRQLDKAKSKGSLTDKQILEAEALLANPNFPPKDLVELPFGSDILRIDDGWSACARLN